MKNFDLKPGPERDSIHSKRIGVFFYLLTGLLVLTCLIGGIYSCNRKPTEKPKIIKEIPKIEKIKVVFIVTNKNIDFNKMAIDEIVDQIQKDSVLEVKKISPEIFLKPQVIRVYRVEDITCPYLKERFKNNDPGELVYEYSGKILIKLSDGVIKVYSEEHKKYLK